MNNILPLDRMTLEDKLRALEDLWTDLSRTPETVPAPEWHGEVLRSRTDRVAEAFTDWTEAKQRLRDRVR